MSSIPYFFFFVQKSESQQQQAAGYLCVSVRACLYKFPCRTTKGELEVCNFLPLSFAPLSASLLLTGPSFLHLEQRTCTCTKCAKRIRQNFSCKTLQTQAKTLELFKFCRKYKFLEIQSCMQRVAFMQIICIFAAIYWHVARIAGF